MRFLFSLIFFLWCGARSDAAAGLTVVGSDLLGAPFATAVADFARGRELTINLDLSGTRLGYEQLQAGKADLGLLVFDPKEKIPGDPYVVAPVAYHTAVVVVPAELSLTQLSIQQLRTIYGESEAAPYKRWNDLGVAGSWGDIPILPVISGPGGGLSYDLFRYTVLTSPKLRTTVTLRDDGPAALKQVSGRDGGIVVVPVLPAGNPALKTLLLARGVNDVAFGPTPDNLYSGDYPIRLPLYLVFRKDAAPRVLPLLRFFLSEDAVPLWQNAQLIPLPAQARTKEVFDAEAL